MGASFKASLTSMRARRWRSTQPKTVDRQTDSEMAFQLCIVEYIAQSVVEMFEAKLSALLASRLLYYAYKVRERQCLKNLQGNPLLWLLSWSSNFYM